MFLAFAIFDTGQLSRDQLAFTDFMIHLQYHQHRDRNLALLTSTTTDCPSPKSEHAHTPTSTSTSTSFDDSVDCPILRFNFRDSDPVSIPMESAKVDVAWLSECWTENHEGFDYERVLKELRRRKGEEDPMYVFAVLPNGEELEKFTKLTRVGPRLAIEEEGIALTDDE
ncbi:hypothetical protein D9758_017654 [Tetrapyrgos nigripes]|uniref:Uncharacterized protein n=1 Tax=Tetrapyrgos nigripes TaxID=182062 RepID=A0A8H5CFI3_9AGAR|nr:hypothetical protein D9758_017654 [Tetrapyrgos nigripes]